MPEPQKPFVHQDGTATPLPGRTPVEQLLSIASLGNQVRELEREAGMRRRLYPVWVDRKKITQAVADVQERQLQLAIESLQLLKEPTINAGVLAMKGLQPSYQALVVDIALALVGSVGGHQQQLANDLRKLIGSRS